MNTPDPLIIAMLRRHGNVGSPHQVTVGPRTPESSLRPSENIVNMMKDASRGPAGFHPGFHPGVHPGNMKGPHVPGLSGPHVKKVK